MKSIMGKIKLEYDSDFPKKSGSVGPPGVDLDKIYDPMVGGQINFQISKEGKVTELTGMDEIFEKISKNNQAMSLLLNNLKSSMSDNSLKKSTQQALDLHLPKTKVRIGDTWSESGKLDLPMIGILKFEGTFRLKEVKKIKGARIAFIQMNLVLKPDNEQSIISLPMGINFKCEKINQEGIILFDIDKGMLKKSTVYQSSVMEVNNPIIKLQMKIDQKIKIQINVKPTTERAAEKKQNNQVNSKK